MNTREPFSHSAKANTEKSEKTKNTGKLEEIFSKNSTFQKFEVLKANRNKRHRYGEFIVEGVRNINEAIKNNWHIKSFIYPRKRELSNWAKENLQLSSGKNYAITDELMAELSNRSEPSELLAILDMTPPMRDSGGSTNSTQFSPTIVLFDRPSNKGNLGTMLRSCDAFGIEQLILTGHGVDIYEPEVIQASMGSFFKIPFMRLDDKGEIEGYITKLREEYPEIAIIATAENSGQAIYNLQLTKPLLIMLGNEKDGLNRHLLSLCDYIAEIPMTENKAASSLNVSCAATVVFYEILRQRM